MTPTQTDPAIEPVPPTELPAPVANGTGYLSAETAIENAPQDLEELDVDGVFGGRVRIRALTAAQVALVKQAGVTVTGNGQRLGFSFDAIEREQFRFGVIRPAFNADQVRTLQTTSGRSWAKVIDAIDRISAMDKEALRDAQKDFPGLDER